jgi:aspartokinase
MHIAILGFYAKVQKYAKTIQEESLDPNCVLIAERVLKDTTETTQAIKAELEARQQAIRDDARMLLEFQKRQLADQLSAQEDAVRRQQELTEAARERELEAVRAHGERMIALQREIVGQTAGVSADLITALAALPQKRRRSSPTPR